MPPFKIDLLHSRFLLFGIFALSLCNIIGFFMIYNYYIPTIFVLVCIILFNYSQNMIIVLSVSLGISNAIHIYTNKIMGLDYGQQYEGMDNENENDKKKKKKKGESNNENGKMEKEMATAVTSAAVAAEKEEEKEKENEKDKEKEKKSKDKDQNENSKIEGMQASYKELMTMQTEILQNISSLESKLDNADNLLDKMKKNIKT